MTKEQKKALRGLIGGIGFIFLLIGTLTNLYSTNVGVIIALAVWVVVIPALGVMGFGVEKGTTEAAGNRKSSGLAIFIIVSVIVIVLLLIVASIVGLIISGSFNKSSSGNLITETRSVSNFSKIELEGYGNLIIDQTGKESLEIEADEKMINNIKTRVVGDSLRIEIDKPWTFWGFFVTGRKINYHLTVDELESIKVSGSASIQTKGLKANRLDIRVKGSGRGNMAIDVKDLDVDVSGSGRFNFSGKAQRQDIRISGSGEHNAKRLESKTVDVTISGSGRGVVRASDELDVTISGSGDLQYLGSPTVSENISGSGNVSKY